jgi:hypothetical protein
MEARTSQSLGWEHRLFRCAFIRRIVSLHRTGLSTVQEPPVVRVMAYYLKGTVPNEVVLFASAPHTLIVDAFQLIYPCLKEVPSSGAALTTHRG